MSIVKYRADIDGIRAIAILLVIFYHAFPNIIPGGFVGVDIFFVISGYLITNQIVNSQKQSSFSIKLFYVRRIKRIFPALLCLMFFCLMLGWVCLTPQEYEQLGTHVAGAGLFIPNFVLWKEAGYFDNAAITKPLLHLWSLGIEEQFYIVWPIFICILLRAFPGNISIILKGCVVFLICSLFYSVYLSHKNIVADFYSPLSRAYELALGGCLSILMSKDIKVSRRCFEGASFLGLILIGLSIVLIEPKTLFPAAWALLPTSGAFLLIFGGAAPIKSWVQRYFLSTPIMVWIGLISYPLYLWHWPLLSFGRILQGQSLNHIQILFILITAVILSWLSYRLIEKPIRSSKHHHRLALILICMMAIAITFGIVLRKYSGFKQRHENLLNGNPETLVLGENRAQLLRKCTSAGVLASNDDCVEDAKGNIKYAMVGDSKAQALFYGVVETSSSQGKWVLITHFIPPLDGQVSQIFQNKLDALSAMKNIKLVALVIALRDVFPIDNRGFVASTDKFSEQVKNYSKIIAMLERSGKKVVFVLDNPTFPDPTSCIAGKLTSLPLLEKILVRRANPLCEITYQQYKQGVVAYLHFAQILKEHAPQLLIYDTSPLLCNVRANYCAIKEGRNFLYSYGDHISDYAAKKIGIEFNPLINKLFTD